MLLAYKSEAESVRTGFGGSYAEMGVTSTDISISFCNLNFSGSGVDLGVLEGNITALR